MSNKLFIGISGKMCTGKSTISHLLQAALQEAGKVDIMSLASPLYKAQELLYKEYDIQIQGDKDRDLLIALGQWGRNKDSNFWLEQFARQAIESDSEIIICDDVRFENEANFFKERGFLFRIEGEQRGENIDESRSSDATETSLDNYKFDHVITNDKEPALMCQAIANVMLGK